MNIFNGYDDGYANGLQDAQNGRSKRYTGFSKFSALFTDNAYYDTYVQGYDDGYKDGTAKKNEIYKS